MTELARSYRDGRLLSISEIARNENLPLAYLEQLVGELRRAGLVEGTRGVRGGYRLSRGPENITVGVRYQDSVVRRGADGWLIAHRHVDPDWRQGNYPPV